MKYLLKQQGKNPINHPDGDTIFPVLGIALDLTQVIFIDITSDANIIQH